MDRLSPCLHVDVSVVQAENILWGFQLAWYLVLVVLAGVLFILDHPSLPRRQPRRRRDPCCYRELLVLPGAVRLDRGALASFLPPSPGTPHRGVVGSRSVDDRPLPLQVEHERGASYLTAMHFPSPSIRFSLRINRGRARGPTEVVRRGRRLVTAVVADPRPRTVLPLVRRSPSGGSKRGPRGHGSRRVRTGLRLFNDLVGPGTGRRPLRLRGTPRTTSCPRWRVPDFSVFRRSVRYADRRAPSPGSSGQCLGA